MGSLMGLTVTVAGVFAVESGFGDVPMDHWASEAVANLKSSEVIVGYTDGTFRPNANISRAEVAVIVNKNNQLWSNRVNALEEKLSDKIEALEKQVADLEDDEPVSTETEMYHAGLSSTQEVPPTDSTATGMAKVWVENGVLKYEVDVENLSGAITGAHIHVGKIGENGPDVHPLTFTNGSADGSWEFTDADWKNLQSGSLYINVHTDKYPNGEIRGQILPQMYMGTFKGANVVPGVETAGTGTGKFWIEDGKLKYEINVNSLSGDVTTARIHMGTAGIEGDSVHDITFNESGEGASAAGAWTLTEQNWLDLAANKFYVSVNTAANPEGEIRAQIEPDFAM